jgi:uncharacterized protein YgbK (DUF1537 family)
MQQTPTPAPPSVPAPRVPVQPAIPAEWQLGTPRVGQDLAALRARQTELKAQLRTLESMRGKLSNQLDQIGHPDARAGIVDRIAQVDKRIVQIDAEIAGVERQIASAGPELAAGTMVPPPLPSGGGGDDAVIVLPALLIIFVVFPLVLAYTRRIWKRTSSTPAIPRELSDLPKRIERMEQAIDAVAIEVERVSEGQRFVTRLMTENQLGPAVAAVRASAGVARDLAAQPPEGESLKALGPGGRPFEPIEVAEREEARLRGRR